MLRRSLVAIRYAFDALRCSLVDAMHAARRAGGAFYADASCQDPLVLVRSADREPHFRRYPRLRQADASAPLRTTPTAHKRAVRRLELEITCGEGLHCVFHDGTLSGKEPIAILQRGYESTVAVERGVRLNGARYVPDLLVLSRRTGVPLLAIEVRASHPVGIAKRAAYQHAGLRWIEVSALHTIRRYRRLPLCVEHWGGSGFPPPPEQPDLFARTHSGAVDSGTCAVRRPLSQLGEKLPTALEKGGQRCIERSVRIRDAFHAP
jgi:hypothetical protein